MEIMTADEITTELTDKWVSEVYSEEDINKKWVSFDDFLSYHKELAEYLLEQCENKVLIDISNIQIKHRIDELMDESGGGL